MQTPNSLVIGATGRVGKVLRHIWGAAYLSGDTLWQSRHFLSGFVTFDPLTDCDAFVSASRDRDVILCLAGVTSSQHGNLADNVTLAKASIRAAAASGTRVLLLSSSAVYGKQTGVLSEAALLRPVSDYGCAKSTMEQEDAALAAELGVTLTSIGRF